MSTAESAVAGFICWLFANAAVAILTRSAVSHRWVRWLCLVFALLNGIVLLLLLHLFLEMSQETSFALLLVIPALPIIMLILWLLRAFRGTSRHIKPPPASAP